MGKPHSEHMFSGMLRIAAENERREHLRSAPYVSDVRAVTPELKDRGRDVGLMQQ
jgi:hypothetical protein